MISAPCHFSLFYDSLLNSLRIQPLTSRRLPAAREIRFNRQAAMKGGCIRGLLVYTTTRHYKKRQRDLSNRLVHLVTT